MASRGICPVRVKLIVLIRLFDDSACFEAGEEEEARVCKISGIDSEGGKRMICPSSEDCAAAAAESSCSCVAAWSGSKQFMIEEELLLLASPPPPFNEELAAAAEFFLPIVA